MIPRRWAHQEPGEHNMIQAWARGVNAPTEDVLREWERRTATYLNMPDVAAVNSGRQGLRILLDHLGVGPGDEMIVPAYTLGEMLPFVQSLGVNLIPADIDIETFNITPATIARRITSKTRAILALHLFGAPCDIEGITRLAGQHKLTVIEDCAHALGATVNGRATGTFGDAAFFSFEITKTINTYGGGLVVSRHAELVEKARAFNNDEPQGNITVLSKLRGVRTEQTLFRTQIMYAPLYLLATPRWQPLMNRLYRDSQSGLKKRERYSPIQAAIGLRKLDNLEERLELRRARAGLLNALLKPEIRPQRVLENTVPTSYFYVVLLPEDAAQVRRRLLLRGVDAGAGNEIMDNCAELLGYEDCPVAAEVYRRALALPMFDGITEAVCERVARALNGLV